MATSGTYRFNMSRDDTIRAALRLTTRFGSGDPIPPEDIADCALALNIICKTLAIKGWPLWCVQTLQLPFVAGQATYNLSTASGNTLPLRILDAWWRSPTGNDVTLTPTSRYDADTLGQKSSPGIPNQYWYDPQLSGGIMTVYNVPQDANGTLFVVIQRQIQDVNLATDNLDFPQEAYRMLRWMLADEIAIEYSTPADVRAEINAKANSYEKDFFDSPHGQEQVSVTFTPNMQGGAGGR